MWKPHFHCFFCSVEQVHVLLWAFLCMFNTFSCFPLHIFIILNFILKFSTTVASVRIWSHSRLAFHRLNVEPPHCWFLFDLDCIILNFYWHLLSRHFHSHLSLLVSWWDSRLALIHVELHFALVYYFFHISRSLVYLSFSDLAVMPHLVFLVPSAKLMNIFSIPSFRSLVRY